MFGCDFETEELATTLEQVENRQTEPLVCMCEFPHTHFLFLGPPKVLDTMECPHLFLAIVFVDFGSLSIYKWQTYGNREGRVILVS